MTWHPGSSSVPYVFSNKSQYIDRIEWLMYESVCSVFFNDFTQIVIFRMLIPCPERLSETTVG
jgi:hypothetical protein